MAPPPWVGVFIALFVGCGGWSRDVTSSLYEKSTRKYPYDEVNDDAKWSTQACTTPNAACSQHGVVEDGNAYCQSGAAENDAMYPHRGEAKDNFAYCHGGAAKDNATYCCGNAVDNNTVKRHDCATDNNATYCHGKMEEGDTYR